MERKAAGLASGAVIGVVEQDCQRTVNLFGQQNPHKTVRPSEFAESQLHIGPRGHRLAVTIRPPDQQYKILNAAIAVAGDFSGPLRARHLAPTLIQCDHDRAPIKPCEQAASFIGLAQQSRGGG